MLTLLSQCCRNTTSQYHFCVLSMNTAREGSMEREREEVVKDEREEYMYQGGWFSPCLDSHRAIKITKYTQT